MDDRHEQIRKEMQNNVKKYLLERYLDINKLNKQNIIAFINAAGIQTTVYLYGGSENYNTIESILEPFKNQQSVSITYENHMLGRTMARFIKELVWWEIIPNVGKFDSNVHRYTYTKYLENFPLRYKYPEETKTVEVYMGSMKVHAFREEVELEDIVQTYMNTNMNDIQQLNQIYKYFALETVPNKNNIYECMIRDVYVAYMCRHVDAEFTCKENIICKQRKERYESLVSRYRAKIGKKALEEPIYKSGDGELGIFGHILGYASGARDSGLDPIHPDDPIHPGDRMGFTRRKSVRKSRRKSVRKSRRKSVRKSRRKSVRKSRRKSVRKSRRKSVRKSRRKSVRKSRRKSVRK
jgi:hypothetical protein